MAILGTLYNNTRGNLLLPWRLARVLVLSVLFVVTVASCGSPTTPVPGVAAPPFGSGVQQSLLGALAIDGAQHPSTPPPALSTNTAYLINADTGAVYLAQNGDTEVAMASTTKIMTAVVALTMGHLDQRITIGPDTVALQNGISSVAGLQEGDVLTLHDLLYALLLPSGDDAAVAIAEGVAGSQARFIALMNAEAALLGLGRTHYNDVHGLDTTDHYTTAHDLVRLARFAMSIPTIAQIVATATYTLPATADHQAYTWQTTNLLLTTMPYSGVTGIKTGFTGNAGACLVFSATRGGHTLLGVVLGEPNDTVRFTDATALLDWGFAFVGEQ